MVNRLADPELPDLGPQRPRDPTNQIPRACFMKNRPGTMSGGLIRTDLWSNLGLAHVCSTFPRTAAYCRAAALDTRHSWKPMGAPPIQTAIVASELPRVTPWAARWHCCKAVPCKKLQRCRCRRVAISMDEAWRRTAPLQFQCPCGGPLRPQAFQPDADATATARGRWGSGLDVRSSGLSARSSELGPGFSGLGP